MVVCYYLIDFSGDPRLGSQWRLIETGCCVILDSIIQTLILTHPMTFNTSKNTFVKCCVRAEVDPPKSTNSQGGLVSTWKVHFSRSFLYRFILDLAGFMRSIGHKINTFILIIGIQNLQEKVFFAKICFNIMYEHIFSIVITENIANEQIPCRLLCFWPQLLFPLIHLISSSQYLQLTLTFDN